MNPPTGPTGAQPPSGGAVAPELPGLSFDDRERTLDPAIVSVWRLVSAASMLVPALALSIAGFILLDVGAWLVLVIVVSVFLLVVLWLPSARYARWRWQLSPLAIELRHGIIVRRHEAVPYFRIQQIDVSRGPLDRLLGLATLQVTTASASGSAALPGIGALEAPSVRAELLARAARAVAAHPGDLQDAV